MVWKHVSRLPKHGAGAIPRGATKVAKQTHHDIQELREGERKPTSHIAIRNSEKAPRIKPKPIIFMRHHNNRWSVEWVTKTGAHHSRGGFTHYDRALNYLNAKRKLHPDWEYKGLVR